MCQYSDGEQSLGPSSLSNTFTAAISHSRDLPEGNFLDTDAQTSSNINDFDYGFSMFPPGTPPDFEPNLGVDDLHFPQQHVGTAYDVTGTTATCTITNGTCSPRSVTNPLLFETNDGTTRSQDGGSEHLLFGSDGFSPGLGNEWPLSLSSSSFLPLVDPGRTSYLPTFICHLTIARRF
jgi:hypothetical protein